MADTVAETDPEEEAWVLGDPKAYGAAHECVDDAACEESREQPPGVPVWAQVIWKQANGDLECPGCGEGNVM